MSTINRRPYSNPRNINLKDGILRFGKTLSATPFNSTSDGMYINSSHELALGLTGSTFALSASVSSADKTSGAVVYYVKATIGGSTFWIQMYN